MGRTLIIVGILLVAAGVLVTLGDRLPLKLGRLPGDIVLIAGCALPALYIAYLGIRYTVKRVTLEEPEDILFTDLDLPDGAATVSDDEATAARIT